MARTRWFATPPLLFWALLLLLCSAAPSPARAADSPPKVVQGVADSVVAVLAEKGLTADQKREKAPWKTSPGKELTGIPTPRS